MPTPRSGGGVSVTVEIELEEQWAVQAVFGGWIALTLARVAATLLPQAHVLASASLSFARAVQPGAATVTATLTRSGRSYGFVTCELSTPTGIAVTAQFTFVPRDRLPAVSGGTSTPDLPPSSPSGARGSGVARQVDWRAESDWSHRPGDGDPFVAWLRADETMRVTDAAVTDSGATATASVVDPAWYLVAADLIGPALVTPARRAFWVATVTLEVQVHALTTAPWLRQTLTARTVGADAVGALTLATGSGDVLATSTQRAVLIDGQTVDLPYSVTAFGWGVPRDSDEVPVEVHE